MSDFDYKRAQACLWGCAMGDSLGLPYENLSANRICKLLHGRSLDHRFVLGKGMVSDDTDHSLIVAGCLIKHPDDPVLFQNALARQLTKWLISIPPGVGFATLKSILKLSLGYSPQNSGVFSAGNGPAMRSAIIGCLVPDDSSLRRQFTEKSAQLTHSDPKAAFGAIAIAEITATLCRGEWEIRPTVDELKHLLLGVTDDKDWLSLVDGLTSLLDVELPLEQVVAEVGCDSGVSGYVYHTVPFAIACWYRNFGNFERSIEECIRGGGDTDTTAAICGAIAVLSSEEKSIPPNWQKSILLWPFNAQHMALKNLDSPGVLRVGLRNGFSLVIILVHCLRRCLPPY